MVVLDKLFLVFHTLLISFILVGWVWRRTRIPHLLLLLAIALSWFGLGLFMGIGYCPCTDWHWQVRASLGETKLPHSYIEFLLDSWFGLELESGVVETGTAILYFAALLLSVLLLWRDQRTR